MARDVYGPMITSLLEEARQGGLTSNEIIESIRGIARPAERQTSFMDTGWGIRAALNRMFRKGLIAKIFEVEKDANGRPVDRPPRVEMTQFGEERIVRVGPMRRYRFYLRGFEPKDRPFVDLKPLPPEREKAGTVKALTREQITKLQAEGKLPNDVQGRGKPE